MCRGRIAWGGLSLVLVSLCTRDAAATYSIAATDSATQQVGGAVTSCVGSLDLGSVYGSVPGKGVVHAQAQLDQRRRGKNLAIMLLGQGIDPVQIITQMTDPSLDSGYASRQYGVVDTSGRAAGFTGSRAQAYKRDQHGSTGSFTYSVQGNILTSQKVLDQAADAFAAGGCDLADRLMAALEAGGKNGEGDSRCTREGIPSDAAFIQVDLPGAAAGSYLKLQVSNTAPENPLVELRAMFDTWRKSHPCMMAGAAGSGGRGASGSSGSSAGVSGSSAGSSAGVSGSSSGGSAAGAAGISAASAGRSGSDAGHGGAGAAAGAAAVAGSGGAPRAGDVGKVTGGGGAIAPAPDPGTRADAQSAAGSAGLAAISGRAAPADMAASTRSGGACGLRDPRPRAGVASATAMLALCLVLWRRRRPRV